MHIEAPPFFFFFTKRSAILGKIINLIVTLARTWPVYNIQPEMDHLLAAHIYNKKKKSCYIIIIFLENFAARRIMREITSNPAVDTMPHFAKLRRPFVCKCLYIMQIGGRAFPPLRTKFRSMTFLIACNIQVNII